MDAIERISRSIYYIERLADRVVLSLNSKVHSSQMGPCDIHIIFLLKNMEKFQIEDWENPSKLEHIDFLLFPVDFILLPTLEHSQRLH